MKHARTLRSLIVVIFGVLLIAGVLAGTIKDPDVLMLSLLVVALLGVGLLTEQGQR